jgi:hypothetical protein
MGRGGLLTNHLRSFSPFSLLSQFLLKADLESMAVLVLQAAAIASLRSFYCRPPDGVRNRGGTGW